MQLVHILVQIVIRYWWVVAIVIGVRWGGAYVIQWMTRPQTIQYDTNITNIRPTVPVMTPENVLSPTSSSVITDGTPVIVTTPTFDHAQMHMSTVEDFRDAMLDAFRQRHTQFEAEFTGNQQDLAQVYALIDNYYDPHRIISITATSSPRTTAIRATIKYASRSEDASLVQQRVEELVQELITPDMSPHQKVRLLHDWVVRNTVYDESLTRYDAYDIFVDGTAVCQGYALLLDALLTEAGFNTVYVTGKIKPAFRGDTNSTSDGGHAWNMVQIDGQWYHLDATWDDPIPDQPDQVQYNYYMLTDAEIGITRTFDNDFSNYLRPIADTSYAETLQSAVVSDVRYTPQIQQIIKDANLQYIADDTLFRTADLQRFTKYIDQFTDTPFVFRAANEPAVSSLIQHYVQHKGISVRYSIAPFLRTPDPNDVLVEVIQRN